MNTRSSQLTTRASGLKLGLKVSWSHTRTPNYLHASSSGQDSQIAVNGERTPVEISLSLGRLKGWGNSDNGRNNATVFRVYRNCDLRRGESFPINRSSLKPGSCPSKDDMSNLKKPQRARSPLDVIAPFLEPSTFTTGYLSMWLWNKPGTFRATGSHGALLKPFCPCTRGVLDMRKPVETGNPSLLFHRSWGVWKAVGSARSLQITNPSLDLEAGRRRRRVAAFSRPMYPWLKSSSCSLGCKDSDGSLEIGGSLKRLDSLLLFLISFSGFTECKARKCEAPWNRSPISNLP